MISLRRALLASLSGALLLASCATPPIVSGVPKIVAGQELAAYAIHEECVELTEGERINYRFTSSVPVQFNIHFHDGNAVILPITRDNTIEDADSFTADRKQDYCLMWEAGAAGAVLDYRLTRLPPLP